MIDTHCHVDLYDAPLEVANEAETMQVKTIAVTYLPTHFRQAQSHLRTFRYVKPALGLHPLAAKDHERAARAGRRRPGLLVPPWRSATDCV